MLTSAWCCWKVSYRGSPCHSVHVRAHSFAAKRGAVRYSLKGSNVTPRASLLRPFVDGAHAPWERFRNVGGVWMGRRWRRRRRRWPATCEAWGKEDELRGLSLAARVCDHCRPLFSAAKTLGPERQVPESCESIKHLVERSAFHPSNCPRLSPRVSSTRTFFFKPTGLLTRQSRPGSGKKRERNKRQLGDWRIARQNWAR